jgi:rSAM/selenodomain-associated transferase 1
MWGAGTKILYTIFAARWSGGGSCPGRPARPRLIVFMRYPEAGRVKTRLMPALGPEGAAAVHEAMACHTLAWAEDLERRLGAHVEIRFDGGSIEAMAARFGRGRDYVAQPSGDLGERLARAAADAFDAGDRPVVLVGTDCPGITAEIAHRAFEALKHQTVVLGPARDGGYYLIGLARPLPSLFEGVNWGTEQVLAQTRRRSEAAGLSPVLLPELDDVDRPEDLAVWERIAGQKTPCA